MFGIDDEPIIDSSNLVMSGGVFGFTLPTNIMTSLINTGGFFQANTYAHISGSPATYLGLSHGDEYDCCFVFLKDVKTSVIVTNNIPLRFVFFSDISFDIVNYLDFNSTGIVPAGAKMCIVNFSKASNPSGYGDLRISQANDIVFAQSFDKKLNDSIKLFNKNIGCKDVIDISSQPLHDGWCSAQGTFVDVNNGGSHLTFERGNYQQLTIKASASGSAFVLFLSRFFREPTAENEDYTKFLCIEETRRTVPTGTTSVLNIPDDCYYIVIGYDSVTSTTIYRPVYLSFDTDGLFTTEIDDLKSTTSIIYQESDNNIVDLSGPYQAGWIMANNTFANVTTLGGEHVTISVGNFKKFKITGTKTAEYDSFFFFAKSNYREPSSNNESFSPYLCSGQTGRITVPYNTTVEYDIPSDCAYIIIGYRSQSSVGAYRPQNASLYTEAGIIERVDNLEQRQSLKLLAIGNSFSRDSLSYVPVLLQSVCPSLNVVIGVLYRGSASLQDHWDNRDSSTYYELDIFISESNKWVSFSSKGLDDGLTYTDWDIITLQQNSANSGKYNTFQPYLNNLIGYIATKCHNYKIGWLLTHSYSDGYTTEWTSEQMAANIRTASERVMNETSVDILFPYGTAIQNARSNGTLDSIGDGGGLCYSDYIHLQEGLGCQIAAYANAIVLLKELGIVKSINGNTIIVDSSFDSQYNIPQPHGTPVGSNESNCILGQKAAILAVKHPYTTSEV